jgi:hypothetical protein
MNEELSGWNDKKLSKVHSQMAQSKSIAANFDTKRVCPPEPFAGTR